MAAVNYGLLFTRSEGSGATVKKGRHRRFEEARDLKRAVKVFEVEDEEPCPECGAEPGKEHASWCLATEDDSDEDDSDEDDPEEVAYGHSEVELGRTENG